MKFTSVFVFFNIAFWFVGCQSASVKETIPPYSIANYSDKSLTSTELIEEIKKNAPSLLTDSTVSEEQIADFVNRLIDYKLKVADGYARGFGNDADLLSEYDTYKKGLATAKILDGQIKKDLVNELYERKKEMIKVAHILISVAANASPADTLKSYEKAMDIKSKIINGMPFAEAAVQFSGDRSALENKGELNWVTGGDLVYPFEQAIYNAKVGDLIGPVRTQFGYHLIKIIGRKPATPEREISHIMIRRQGTDTLALINRTDSILQVIRSGQDYTALAARYSEDERSSHQGGFIGVWRENGQVPQFDNWVYHVATQAGDISPVIRTRWGYHIIRLDKISTNKSKEQLIEELTPIVNRQQDRIESRKTQFIADLYKKLDLKVDNKLFDELVSDVLHLVPNKAASDPAIPVPDSSNINFSPIGKNGTQIFVTGKNTTIYLQEFLGADSRELLNISMRIDSSVQKTEIKKLLDNYIYSYYINHLESYDPEFKDMLATYKDGLVLFKWLETVLWKVDMPSDTVLRPIYEETIINYNWDERRQFALISFSNFEKADTLVRDKKLADLDAIKKVMKKNKITVMQDTILVEKYSHELIDKIWDLPIGVLNTKPEYYNGKKIYVLPLLHYPPMAKTFDEARQEVFRRYYDQVVKHRETDTIDQLRSQAQVTVDSTAIQQFTTQIKK